MFVKLTTPIMNQNEFSDTQRIDVLRKTINFLSIELVESYKMISSLVKQRNDLLIKFKTNKEAMIKPKKSAKIRNLLIIISLMFVLSCEREAEYCWDCLVTNGGSGSGGSWSMTSHIDKCGYSTREIELFEQEKNAVCTKKINP
jgi:hypothetical protein